MSTVAGSDLSLSARSRLLSLDAFRGMTIAAMILVNAVLAWMYRRGIAIRV